MTDTIDLTDEVGDGLVKDEFLTSLPLMPSVPSIFSSVSSECIVISDDDDDIVPMESLTNDTDIDAKEQSVNISQLPWIIPDLHPASDPYGSPTESPPPTTVNDQDDACVDIFQSFRNLMTKDIRYFQGDKSRRWGSINEYSSPEERSALDRFKADFEAKFFEKNSVREIYAFLKAQNERLVDFVEDPFDEDFRALDNMPHCLRQLVKDLAVILYDIRVDTRGKNSDEKYSVIVRTEATKLPRDWKEMSSRRIRHGLARICWNEWIAFRRVRDDQESNFIELWKDPLSSDNIGHQMLLRMGWKPGQGLGLYGDGIREPVTISFRAPQLGADNDAGLFDEEHYEKALS